MALSTSQAGLTSALCRASTVTKNHTSTSKLTAWVNIKSRVTSNTHRRLITLHNGDEVFPKPRQAHTVPEIFKSALRNQRVDSFKVLKRVGSLAYKIDLSPTTFKESFGCLFHTSSEMTTDVSQEEKDVAEREPSDLLAPFYPAVPYLSERTSLVSTAIKLLLTKRVIAIRAPPATGKSTLLALIGKNILRYHEDLEPVELLWNRRSAEEIRKESFNVILGNALEKSKERNKAERERLKQISKRSHCSSHSGGPDRVSARSTKLAKEINYDSRAHARPVFLIDEAQNSYNEVEMWDKLFKNPDATGDALFVLVFVYGSAGGTVEWGPHPWQAAHIETRIELHPNGSGKAGLLLSTSEIEQMVDKWARSVRPGFQIGSDVIEYLEFETQGHAGMLGRVLAYLATMASDDHMDRASRNSLVWDGAKCHRFLHHEDHFLNSLNHFRGLWTQKAEDALQGSLEREKKKNSQYRYLTIRDIRQGLKQAASLLGGYKSDRSDPALEYCHEMGLLQTEIKDEKFCYAFPSRLHQRFAYGRLFPEPGPDASPDR